MIQKPATSSFDSANGPSSTVRLLPEKRTRAPFELGCSPSAASSTPAFISSSLYLPMSVRSFSLGITPASVLLLALTITMKRMALSPLVLRFGGPGLRRFSAVPVPGSTVTTNGVTRDRQPRESFLGRPEPAWNGRDRRALGELSLIPPRR